MQVTVEIPDELAGQLDRQGMRLAEIIRRGLRPPGSGRMSVVEEVFDFLSGRPSPEEIIAFTPSAKSVEHLDQLLDRNREGSLTAQEDAELDTLQSLNHLFALIKLQARQELLATS